MDQVDVWIVSFDTDFSVKQIIVTELTDSKPNNHQNSFDGPAPSCH